MIDCVSVATMRESDAYTIKNTTPSKTLMYRAAMGIYRAVGSWKNTAIVCGGGNNGGDGFALACILSDMKIPCVLFTLSDSLSCDGEYFFNLAKEKGVDIFPYIPGCLSSSETVADCMLGTGFSGEVRGLYTDAIEEINSLGAFVVSADINSGMNGDTGEGSLIVASDVTVTVGLVKTGLVSENAKKYINKLVLADIGISAVKKESYIVSENEWKSEYKTQKSFISAPGYFCKDILNLSDINFSE